MENSTDVLVIGAGPAGSIAASAVHKAGLSVRVVERETFPRFVIGESLLPRCMEVLDHNELLEPIKSQQFQEKFGARFLRANGEVADYDFSESFTPGWTWTWQVPRAVFDTAVTDELQRRGVRIDFGATVQKVEFNSASESFTTVKCDGGTEVIKARFIIDASGYGRVIPRQLGMERPSGINPRKAVFAHLRDIRRHESDEPDRITIVIYQQSLWVWIIPFSNGITSVGFVGDLEHFESNADNVARQFLELIEGMPSLRKRFDSVPVAHGPHQLMAWSVASEKFYGPGYVLTGNVTEFLDPVFSSGVMFALVSSQQAASLAIRQLRGESVDWEKDYSAMLQKGIDTFRTFVNAWYDGRLEEIFFAQNPDPLIKRQITSILAGYVWDDTNPFVKNPEDALTGLIKRIRARERHLTPGK